MDLIEFLDDEVSGFLVNLLCLNIDLLLLSVFIEIMGLYKLI